MEFKELKKKSVSELHKVLADKREDLRELRFKDANKQLKNVRQIRVVKKLIARVFTLLNGGKEDAKVAKEVKEVKEEIKQDKK